MGGGWEASRVSCLVREETTARLGGNAEREGLRRESERTWAGWLGRRRGDEQVAEIREGGSLSGGGSRLEEAVVGCYSQKKVAPPFPFFSRGGLNNGGGIRNGFLVFRQRQQHEEGRNQRRQLKKGTSQTLPGKSRSPCTLASAVKQKREREARSHPLRTNRLHPPNPKAPSRSRPLRLIPSIRQQMSRGVPGEGITRAERRDREQFPARRNFRLQD